MMLILTNQLTDSYLPVLISTAENRKELLCWVDKRPLNNSLLTW